MRFDARSPYHHRYALSSVVLLAGPRSAPTATRGSHAACLHGWRGFCGCGRQRVRKRRHGAPFLRCLTGVCLCMTTPGRGGGRKLARRERVTRRPLRGTSRRRQTQLGGHQRPLSGGRRPTTFCCRLTCGDTAGAAHRSRQGWRRLRGRVRAAALRVARPEVPNAGAGRTPGPQQTRSAPRLPALT